jgi:hypothetical protein
MTVANSGSGSEGGCPPEIVRPQIYLVSDVRLYREGLVACLALQGRLTILGVGGSEVLSIGSRPYGRRSCF